MHKRAIQFLVALVLGVFIFFFVLQRAGFQIIENALMLLFGFEGIALLLVTFLIIIVGSVRWKGILKAEGKEVSLFKMSLFLVKGFTVDYLTPVSLFGGEALRVILLKKETGDLKSSSSSVIIDKVIDVTAHFIFLVIGVALFLTYGYFYEGAFFIYGAVTTTLFFSALLFFYLRAMRKKSILRFLMGVVGVDRESFASSENGKAVFDVENRVINFFHSNRKQLFKGVLLSMLRHFLLVFRVALLIFFIFEGFYIKEAFAIYGLTILSFLLPLPAALGGLEAISSFGFDVMGLGFSAGTAYAVTVRGVDLVICVIGLALIVRFFAFQVLERVARFIDRMRS